MEFSFNKSKCIILLLFAITLLSIHSSKAQSVSAKDDNILSLSLSCSSNPQCIYSGKKDFLNIRITNNTNQNLEISLIAIDAVSMSSYFKDKKTNKGIPGSSSPPGLTRPDLLKKLTLLPAHETKTIKREFSKKIMKKIFGKSSGNQVIFHVYISTPIHIQGSQEPIGSYQNGKFEPKIFTLGAEVTITKQ